MLSMDDFDIFICNIGGIMYMPWELCSSKDTLTS